MAHLQSVDLAHGRRRASGRSHPLSHHEGWTGTVVASMALSLALGFPPKGTIRGTNDRPGHSGLMLAARITFAHISISELAAPHIRAVHQRAAFRNSGASLSGETRRFAARISFRRRCSLFVTHRITQTWIVIEGPDRKGLLPWN